MRDVWVADAETDPFEHGAIIRPFLWGITNGSTYYEFESTDAFLEFVASLGDVVIYAHNGGKFDWHFLLHALEEFSPVMIIAGRLAKFKIGDAEFRDSYNILPAPLSAYKKDEIDYTIFRKPLRRIPANWRKIQEYLRADCLYLFEMVSEFIKRYGMNLTFASAAMKQWQKLENITAPETTADFYHEFAPYYYGGRVECFHLGRIHSPFRVIDINSAYPFAMKHVHPYGETWIESQTLPIGDSLNRAFITLEAPARGAFPFRMPDGSLEFPADGESRIFHVTGWEYVAARETGALGPHSIQRVLSLPLTIRFDKYIDHFFALKAAAKSSGDKLGYIFAKFFLNGLYGKFAANPEKYSEYIVCDKTLIHGAMQNGYEFESELGPWALMARPLEESRQRFYNLAVGASITGFVRAYLFRAMRQCSGVLYCDTDSIACAGTGSLALDAERLGAWDCEAECTSGGIAGKKLYAFRRADGSYKTASKGVRLTAADILRIADGEDVTYRSEAPTFSAFRGQRYIKRTIRRKGVAKRRQRA